MAQNEPDARGAIAVANRTTTHTRATNPRVRCKGSPLLLDCTLKPHIVQRFVSCEQIYVCILDATGAGGLIVAWH